MKIIDKNGKLFGKISIIDIIIVAAIIFVIASFAAGVSQNTADVAVKKQEVGYTTLIKSYSLYNTEKAPFEVGNNIYGNDGELIGKIVKLEKKPTVIKLKLADGTYVSRDSSEYFDFYLTVEGTGTQTEKGIFASGTLPLIPGNNFTASSKNFNGNSIVLSVEKTK